MKKLCYILLLAGCSSLLSACTYHLELDGKDSPSQLVLYAYPGSGDTTVIYLSHSIPLRGKGISPFNPEKVEVYYSVNGIEAKVLWTADSLPRVPARNYYVVHACKEGDRISVTASLPGWETVSASTTVPHKFPLESIRLQKSPKHVNAILFSIGFKDEASTTDFYAFCVEQKEMTVTDGHRTERYRTIDFDINGDPLLNTSSGLDDILLIDHKFRRNLYYWDDSKVQGRSYKIQLGIPYMPDYEGDFITPWGTEHIVYKVTYRMSLYSLSEELYRYLKSVNEQKGGLNSAGLAPLRPTYSNVLHGVGVMGGCRLYQTEWMDNLKDE